VEDEFEQFIKNAKQDKTSHRLHTLAEQRLVLLLSRLYPHACAVPEISGVLGGRNDLMLFAFDGRRAAFEFFFSPSQVPQDLRLLEQVKADVRIAILLDREVNPKLALEYFRKKPDPFPFLWLSDILLVSHEGRCLEYLRELLDEDASIRHLRRLLSLPGSEYIELFMRQQYKYIEQVFGSQKNETGTAFNLGSFMISQFVAQFAESPVYSLSALPRASKPGVYGLYYHGDYELYAPIAKKNTPGYRQPIYIGKVAHIGVRTNISTSETELDNRSGVLPRFSQHVKSIASSQNLKLEDFTYRFLVLTGSKLDLVGDIETELIKTFRPLWNSRHVAGFSNHDPGPGRSNQQPSPWDTLHPGRSWAAKLKGVPKDTGFLIEEIKRLLS